ATGVTRRTIRRGPRFRTLKRGQSISESTFLKLFCSLLSPLEIPSLVPPPFKPSAFRRLLSARSRSHRHWAHHLAPDPYSLRLARPDSSSSLSSARPCQAASPRTAR